MKSSLIPKLLALLVCLEVASAQDARILEVANIVRKQSGKADWTPAAKDDLLKTGDRVQTGDRSRATVQLKDLFTLRIEQQTTVELTPVIFESGEAVLELKRGAAFIFSREARNPPRIRAPGANGAMHGTQLFVRVDDGGRTFFQVFEGSVTMENGQGRLELKAGEAGEAAPGVAPKRTAVLEARNILQWSLYYPAVLDPTALGMSEAEEVAVAESLAAYRAGDLLGALERYPDHAPAGSSGRLYKAGMLLAVGRLDEARPLLESVPAGSPGRRALDRMIATVLAKEQEPWPVESFGSSADAVAESYYRQSRGELEEARAAARRATEISPHNGYAWTRIAELEFSHGNTKGTRTALARALALTPRNAQTWALQGFVFSAENCMPQARACFEEATRLDGALGNGWLGLGLGKIKAGDLAGGRADLQTAATVEPTASIFHSYLGKAFGMEDEEEKARKDLERAIELDPNDPTPWLYSAIEHQRHNRFNPAIADLEKSIDLHRNRRIYRSTLLLDQDRAVRSANLAKIYQNAGMREVAVREATRAVESDYTNPSAHLFLANSFDALRDPERVSLRYETPWFNELLLANLLSPVGGGPLSQFVSQQEYSKLLEADGLGGSLTTEWRSDSELRGAASLFGNYGKVSFGIDAYYRDDTGDRPANAATLEELYAQFKWQPGPDDIFYFLGKWQDQESQDTFETYDNQPLAPRVDFEENQEPGLLLAGWNHRWAPGSHTLLLVGRLGAKQRLLDPGSRQLLVERDGDALRPGFVRPDMFGFDEFTDPALRARYPGGVIERDADDNPIYTGLLLRGIEPFLGMGEILDVNPAPFGFVTVREFDILTAEIQQIHQTESHTLLAGGRWQEGEFETSARLTLDRDAPGGANIGGFPTPAADQYRSVDFQRSSLYAYDFWRATPWLTLIGGAAWDHIEHPDNFRNPPVNGLQRDDEALSGKFGFTCIPAPWLILRGAYAEGLGGVSFDESVRLEPVQLAGFNQSYRTVISESLAGSVEAPRFKVWGLSAEGQLASRTWWGIAANVIDQNVDRTVGVFTGYDLGVFPSSPSFFADDTPQRLAYREESLALTVNQLLGDEFAVGMGYRVTRSDLRSTFTDLAGSLPAADIRDRATLQELSFHGDWYSPTGLFARIEANYYTQDLSDDPRAGRPPRAGDEFWHFNVLAGYRFNDNLCEVSAGVLNLGNTGYQLSPLNPRGELAQGRTAVLRCRFSF